jgi:hypothetical protein
MVLMSTQKIEGWISGLGQGYKLLVEAKVIPDQPLVELYEGREHLNLKPEEGVDLSFWRKTSCLETLSITLKKTTPSTTEYKGGLPAPYALEMSQSDVRAIFGEPFESKGPLKMPEPMGLTGGWESYKLDAAVHQNIKVVFKYTAALQVYALAFTLIDKGHD